MGGDGAARKKMGSFPHFGKMFLPWTGSRQHMLCSQDIARSGILRAEISLRQHPEFGKGFTGTTFGKQLYSYSDGAFCLCCLFRTSR